MALKIWLNGSMKQIDTSEHKPVIFLNGNKYILEEGYTFINGEKRLLWGKSSLDISYISSTGVLGGGKVFAIGNDWANVYYNSNIYTLNIENLSNPTVKNTYNWGNIVQQTPLQSDATYMSFWAESGGPQNYTHNKISLDRQGQVLVSESRNFTVSVGVPKTAGFTDNDVVMINFVKYAGSGLVPIRVYNSDFYFGNTLVYSMGSYDNSLGWDIGYGYGIQDTSSSILINIGHLGYTSSEPEGLYSLTSSGYTRKTNMILYLVLLDGNILIRNISSAYNAVPTGLEFIDKTTFNVVHTYTPDGTNVKFVGKLSSYYYLIDMNSVNNTAKLVVLNSSDYTTAYTKDLPSDPFEENSGAITFWLDCDTIQQISQTGYLGVSTYDSTTLGLRMVRFSTFINI